MKKLLGCLIVTWVISAGCSRSVVEEESVSRSANADTALVDSAQVAPEINLDLISIQEVPKLLAQRKGKVVVLDLWATW